MTESAQLSPTLAEARLGHRADRLNGVLRELVRRQREIQRSGGIVPFPLLAALHDFERDLNHLLRDMKRLHDGQPVIVSRPRRP